MVISADLDPKIEKLQNILESLKTSMWKQEAEMARAKGKLPRAEIANTAELQVLGRQILSNASSVSGSTVAGSVYGEPVETATRLRTLAWIPEPAIHEGSLSTVLPSRKTQSAVSEQAVSSPTDVTEPANENDVSGLADSDSDDDFDFDATQSLLSNGKELYDSSKYAEAVIFLEKSVARANRLPVARRKQLDLAELPFLIAACKYHLNDLDSAETTLAAIVQQESADDQDAIHKCQISHLLSKIYLIKGNVAAAEELCRQTRKGRGRLLGKKHQDYYSTLGLLSDICRATGNEEEAAVYLQMIPLEIAQERTAIKVGQRGKNAGVATKDETSPAIQTDSPSSKIASKNNDPSEWVLRETFGDHVNAIAFVAFSPDNRTLASTLFDGRILLWDLDALPPRLLRTLAGHTAEVWKAAFSPDGKMLASASRDKCLGIWETGSGAMLRILKGHTESVSAVAFSPRSSLLISGSADGNLKLWDPMEGKVLKALEGHASYVGSVAFSPDGTKLAASGGHIDLWDADKYEHLMTLNKHGAYITSIAFAPDGNTLASAGADGHICLWQSRSGVLVGKHACHSLAIHSVAFAHDGQLASGGADDLVKFWDPVSFDRPRTSLSPLRILAGDGKSPAGVRALAFSPDGSKLAVGRGKSTGYYKRASMVDANYGEVANCTWSRIS